MKLTPRFALVFLLYAATLLIGVGLLAYNSGRDFLRSAIISELQATALEKESALNRWIEERRIDVSTLAADPAIREESSILVASSPGTVPAIRAHDELTVNLKQSLDSGELLEVSLIDPQNGRVLVSTNPNEEGKFKENRPYFLNAKNGPFVQNPYYSFGLQSITMVASSPVRSTNGELLAVLAARLNLDSMNAIISRRTDLRKTQDAYLVNSSSLFITQPRFLTNPAVLQRGVHTQDIENCLKQENGVIETADYRDVPSIVVYRWIAQRDLCLVIKIDEAEAYQPVHAFGGTITIISALALVVAAVLAMTLSQSLTRPILALRVGAARFGRGELSIRLDESSHDELGELAGEFNKMAEALSKQQTYLQLRAEQFFNLTLDLLCTISPTGRLIDTNPAWERMLGYKREELSGIFLKNFIHPDDLDRVTKALQKATEESLAEHFECRFRHMQGQYRWLAWAIVVSPQDQLVYAAARDTTERRLSEERLRQQTEELERSNRELEQFAYVASHDLQEPLRLVSSYVQLLARRYRGKLDQDADDFIDYAVEGANRMKSLITDLLAYSRVGTHGKEMSPVSMEEIFQRVKDNLQLAIAEEGATIIHDRLPEVLGDPIQLEQLLQNLIGNALKFRGPQAPRVHIGVRKQAGHWLFFVRDNGIGIDKKYADRIFVIFQRLHNRDEYPGTGIGLAICRKIIERHGGHIWVESVPGKGATFYFTLQPAESWAPENTPAEVTEPQQKDAVADRAKDLI